MGSIREQSQDPHFPLLIMFILSNPVLSAQGGVSQTALSATFLMHPIQNFHQIHLGSGLTDFPELSTMDELMLASCLMRCQCCTCCMRVSTGARGQLT